TGGRVAPRGEGVAAPFVSAAGGVAAFVEVPPRAGRRSACSRGFAGNSSRDPDLAAGSPLSVPGSLLLAVSGVSLETGAADRSETTGRFGFSITPQVIAPAM